MIGIKLNFRHLKATLLSFVDCFTPLQEKKIVLVVKNTTTFSGSLRIICDLLTYNKYDVYIYKDGKCHKDIKKELLNSGVHVLEKFTFRSIYHLLTAKIFIFSHALRDAHLSKKCKNRVIINVWHGVVFKNIESLMPNIPLRKQKQIQNNAQLINLLIASSPSDQELMSQAFLLEKSKVSITGQPRYDLLKSYSFTKNGFLEKQKREILEIKSTKKFILYAPTFREDNISPLLQISDDEWHKINSFLEKSNMVMGLRAHPYDKDIPISIQELDNITLFTHEKFTETNLLLQFVDVLIVDFSSIWIDYLLLNRPIVGFAKDFDNYLSKERGFAYDFKQTFPDRFNYNVEDLLSHLEEAAQKEYSFDYTHAKALFHTFALEHNFTKEFENEFNKVVKA